MRSIAALMLTLGAACSADISNPVPAHNVTLVATVVGHSASADTIDIRITNSGTAAAYPAPCGAEPLVLYQQFIGGKWTGGVQNFECPFFLGAPLILAPGNSIDIVRVFDSAGRYRFLLSVASSAQLTDSQEALSNAVDVR